jgi:hypothetical protein
MPPNFARLILRSLTLILAELSYELSQNSSAGQISSQVPFEHR